MICLVSPDERGMLEHAGDRPPIGLLYLSATLKAHGVKHRVFDLNHTSTDALIGDFYFTKPEVVGLSVMSPTKKQMQDFARRTKLQSPSTKVIAGGVHVTNSPGDFEVEVRGNGESQLINLLDDLGTHEEFDINRYPIPNRDAVDSRNYKFTLEGLPATTIITGRGCPNRCSFCSNPDKRQVNRDLGNVIQELDEIKERGYEGVYLLDDTFLLNPGRATQVMVELSRVGLKYRVEARAGHVDDVIAEAMGDTGCLVAGIGIESGNNDILRRSHKVQTTDDVRKAVGSLGRHNVKTKGFFILGLPGETEETARQTIRFADELRGIGLGYADFYPLCPYPGSPIGDNPEAYGIEIVEKDESKYLNGGRELVVPTQTRDLKADKIKELIMEAKSRWK